MDKFYQNQKDLTAAKIEFYQNYIEGYLIKLLMGFKKCFIADLFCGAGINGEKLGSPLILLERAKYILTTPQLQNSQIYILFNDRESINIKNLEKELKKINIDEKINIFPIQNKNFEEIIPKILKELKNKITPKFFFLDPYTYSDIKMNDLNNLMNLKNAEILLFVPIFHVYRFANDNKTKKDHKTRIFLENFTTKGIFQYTDINDLLESVKQKIQIELNLDFVRPILLDAGKCKNALFLLTKSQEGMLLMNKIARKKSEDGRGIDLKSCGQPSLFGTKGTSKFESFSIKFKKQIQKNQEITNKEIIKFTIKEEFLPKDAKIILEDMVKNKELKVFDQMGNEIKTTIKYGIAEKPKIITIFKYIK